MLFVRFDLRRSCARSLARARYVAIQASEKERERVSLHVVTLFREGEERVDARVPLDQRQSAVKQ